MNRAIKKCWIFFFIPFSIALADCAIFIKNDTKKKFADYKIYRAEIPVIALVIPLAKDNDTHSVAYKLSDTGLFGDTNEILFTILESYNQCPIGLKNSELFIRSKDKVIVYKYILNSKNFFGKNIIYIPFSGILPLP